MHTKFWLEKVKGRDHSKDLGGDRIIILKWIEIHRVWTGLIWLRTGTSGRLM
jgi:hypothetical protein